jgi:Holliday junction resolvasome RuvABC DNA-binding subunit
LELKQQGNTGFKERVLKLYDLDEVSMVQAIQTEMTLSALEVLGFVRKKLQKKCRKIVKEDQKLLLNRLSRKH